MKKKQVKKKEDIQGARLYEQSQRGGVKKKGGKKGGESKRSEENYREKKSRV